MAALVGGAAGALVGLVSAETFFAHSWTALIAWAGVGVLLGVVLSGKGVYAAGLLYGFFVTVSFVAFGFHGANNKVGPLLVFAIALGAVGAVCGLVLVLIGGKARNLVTRGERI
jgi:hypothetical protein